MPPAPPSLPPLPRDQRKVDLGHIKLLAIFHFVSSALGLIGLLFLCLHFAVMNVVFSNPDVWGSQDNAPPPEMFFEMFGLFRWFYLLFALWGVAAVVLNILSGLGLLKKKWRTFSLIVAGFNCLRIPLGTVLGVFTIVVLSRDSVRELYEAESRQVA